MSEWIGGHPQGSISYVSDRSGYLIRFAKYPSKLFRVSEYETKEQACQGAFKYRKDFCDKNNMTKNMYRYTNNSDGDIEVKLQGDYVGIISSEDLGKFIKRVWYAMKGSNAITYYISSTKRKNLPSKRFHSLIFPEWEEVDHINRNGLDNRRVNLRDGKKDNINVKNQNKRKDNVSGKTGVSYNSNKDCWIIQWPEDGKRKNKSYSVSKYGMDNSKELAIQFRVDLDKRLGINNGYNADCKDKEREYPKQELTPILRKISDKNTSGITGVSFNKTSNTWVAYWKVSVNQRKTKSFSIKKYGDEARDMAIKKRLEMVPDTVIKENVTDNKDV
jgi:hypothetical protein